MPTKSQVIPYNTNLAAEFYVMSVLHRLGADCSLSLGNKKSVDIAVIKPTGKVITIDVKGLAGTTNWPIDNLKLISKQHYLVLLTFKNAITNIDVIPEVYVVPTSQLDLMDLIYKAPGGRKVIQLGRMRAKGKKFENAWKYLT